MKYYHYSVKEPQLQDLYWGY